jgi:hypothetical protein
VPSLDKEKERKEDELYWLGRYEILLQRREEMLQRVVAAHLARMARTDGGWESELLRESRRKFARGTQPDCGDRPHSPSDGVTKERVMIGYISIEEQVDADFSRALRRAFVRPMGARLRGDPAPRALSLDEATGGLDAYNRVRLGKRIVPVEKIVGSVGRF